MSWPPGNAPGRRAAAARHARVPVVAVFLSAASVWEITTKARLGKLPRALAVAADVPGAMASQGFAPLSWSVPSTSTTKDQRLVGAEVAVLGAPRHDLADGVEGDPGRRLDE